MNIAVLKKYGLEMRKSSKPFHGYVEGFLSSYIWPYRHPDDVQDFINEVDLALEGKFHEIEDPDYSDGLTRDSWWFAYITPTHFEIYPKGQPYEDRLIITLADWKEILISWKDCLEV